jgi:NAD(P)-dependent dehydrogenase (short-subunit alcohol dehydrogenase family)
MSRQGRQQSGRLAGRIAVVIGAGAGLGRAIANTFALEGATVVLAGRHREPLDVVAKDVATAGGEAAVVPTDVQVPAQIRALIDAVVSEFGRIDVLFNNVGISDDTVRPFWDVPEDAWDRVFAANVRAMFLAAKYAYPHIPDNGAIINMGSAMSFVGASDEVCYAATKGAVLQMTRAMAADCAPRRIRVNCLCPGSCNTEGQRRFIEQSAHPDDLERAFNANALLERMAEPDEIARAAVFLASDDSSFMTGAALIVDGGWTAGRYGAYPGRTGAHV